MTADVGDYCACNRPVIRPKGTPAHVKIRCLECAVAALGDIVLTDEQKKRRNATAVLTRGGQAGLDRTAEKDRLRRAADSAAAARHAAEYARDVTDPNGRV